MNTKRWGICWICGNEGNSYEHQFKKSDIKKYHPELSQKRPIYKYKGKDKSVRIGGNKSNSLKFKSPICHECNTTRTQPYDNAWKDLSEYVYSNSKLIIKKRSLI